MICMQEHTSAACPTRHLCVSSCVAVGDQIATALRSNAGRVMDLLREWDVDGDGEISRKEFHAAMPKLGLEVLRQHSLLAHQPPSASPSPKPRRTPECPMGLSLEAQYNL